jgi:hypothetical protein
VPGHVRIINKRGVKTSHTAGFIMLTKRFVPKNSHCDCGRWQKLRRTTLLVEDKYYGALVVINYKTEPVEKDRSVPVCRVLGYFEHT